MIKLPTVAEILGAKSPQEKWGVAPVDLRDGDDPLAALVARAAPVTRRKGRSGPESFTARLSNVMVRSGLDTVHAALVPECPKDKIIVRFVVVSGEKSRDRKMLHVNGIDFDAWDANPVVMWCHLYEDFPVGRGVWRAVYKRDDTYELWSDVEFMPSDLYPFAATVGRMYAGGWLRGISAGWRGERMRVHADKAGKPVFVEFLEADYLEQSACPIPIDRWSLAEAVSQQCITGDERDVFANACGWEFGNGQAYELTSAAFRTPAEEHLGGEARMIDPKAKRTKVSEKRLAPLHVNLLRPEEQLAGVSGRAGRGDDEDEDEEENGEESTTPKPAPPPDTFPEPDVIVVIPEKEGEGDPPAETPVPLETPEADDPPAEGQAPDQTPPQNAQNAPETSDQGSPGGSGGVGVESASPAKAAQEGEDSEEDPVDKDQAAALTAGALVLPFRPEVRGPAATALTLAADSLASSVSTLCEPCAMLHDLAQAAYYQGRASTMRRSVVLLRPPPPDDELPTRAFRFASEAFVDHRACRDWLTDNGLDDNVRIEEVPEGFRAEQAPPEWFAATGAITEDLGGGVCRVSSDLSELGRVEWGKHQRMMMDDPMDPSSPYSVDQVIALQVARARQAYDAVGDALDQIEEAASMLAPEEVDGELAGIDYGAAVEGRAGKVIARINREKLREALDAHKKAGKLLNALISIPEKEQTAKEKAEAKEAEEEEEGKEDAAAVRDAPRTVEEVHARMRAVVEAGQADGKALLASLRDRMGAARGKVEAAVSAAAVVRVPALPASSAQLAERDALQRAGIIISTRANVPGVPGVRLPKGPSADVVARLKAAIGKNELAG